jgi:tRNA-dihydrouridine synthase B
MTVVAPRASFAPEAAGPEAAGFFARRIGRGAVLAPMAGFTDAPFRRLCRHFGAAWAVTEMVSAKGLVQGDRRGDVIGEPYPGEPDVVVQVFAAEAPLAAEAVGRLEAAFAPSAFDLNMGCPARKVMHRGCGSELLRDPERAAGIVRAMTQATASPVSVKLRLPPDPEHAVDVAAAVVAAGAAALAVHGRTAAQRYQGRADWARIEEVAAAVPVPVLGSGDVVDALGYRSARARGLGVMIARGSLGRPWVFAAVRGALPPSAADIALVVHRHARDHVSWYGGEAALRSMRAHLDHYAQALAAASAAAGRPLERADALRAALVRVERLHDIDQALAAFGGIEVHDPPADASPESIALVRAPLLRRSAIRDAQRPG